MLEILGSIWWLIVALGLLITFHEFGHYWVARRCGVRVLRFSIGFGKPLLKRVGKSGTEFVVAMIPLGGYVKMLDEREGPVPERERDQAFNNKSLARRTAIIAAGPVFNLIFAVAAFWLMLVVGIPESRPLLGPTSGIALEAGLAEEDLITRVDGREVETWTHTLLALIPPALDRRQVEVEVERGGEHRAQLELPLHSLETFREEQALDDLGLQPWRPHLPAEIGEVVPGSPAERADLMAGDRIETIAGHPVGQWQDIGRLIGENAERGQSLEIGINRQGRKLEFEVTPESRGNNLILGIHAPPLDETQRALAERGFTVLQLGVLGAVPAAFGETWRLSTATLGLLGRMITGKASLSNLAGPITIAEMAKTSARLGFSRFLWFLGLISLTLAIINFLPIPMLDGGHLMYNLVEWVKGSPVSERVQIAGQYLGLMVIIGLMSLAIFNDILRLL